MERVASLIIFLLFIPTSIRKALLLIYWWQVKEYRFDRFWVFLKTKEGKRIFATPSFWVKLFILLSFPLAMILKKYTALFVLLVGFLFLFEDLIFTFELFKRKFRKPVFTLRAKRILATSSVVIFSGLLIGYGTGLFLNFFYWSVLLLALDKLTPLAMVVGIACTQILVNRTKRREVEGAKKLINEAFARDLISIGITGSYGKTTTKEFLATILAKKFKVAKTTGSENTEFGIARKIMASVKKDTDIFVAEMGAYKKGEVAKLADITQPKVGIISGISPQHLVLFGSLRNLLETKYELIDSLPSEGVAIFNGQSRHCLQLAKKKRPQKTIIYQTGKPKNIYYDVLWADKVKVGKKSISFRTHWKDETVEFKAKLLGEQFVENILGAAAVALALGMNLREIRNAVDLLKPVARTMEPIKSGKGYTLIDDSYSTNPAGFSAALDFLDKAKFRKKFVITPGIIELGKESCKIHRSLGRRLAKIVNLVILTSTDFVNELGGGMGVKAASKLVVEKSPSMIMQLLGEAKENDVILIEGRIPESVRRELIK